MVSGSERVWAGGDFQNYCHQLSRYFGSHYQGIQYLGGYYRFKGPEIDHTTAKIGKSSQYIQQGKGLKREYVNVLESSD